MTPLDPADPVATTQTGAGRSGRLAGGLAGAALVIAVVTVLARVAGFGRWLVFSHTAGQTCLATAYSTANQVPNVVFEVVAGGALASVVIPVLAGPVERGERVFTSRTVSALLSWTLVVTVPIVLLGLLVTGPVMRLLVHGDPVGCSAATVVSVGAPMLAVFLPQIPLYGVAVVLGGTLQAHRRFVAPAAMPLVNSVLVAATYVLFALLAHGHQDDITELPRTAWLVLAAGTSFGVLGLAVTVVAPMVRTGVRIRPTLRFPPGVARRIGRLASAGLAVLVAQQLSSVVVIWLANDVGGYLVIYNYAWALYLLPYAVLAVPLATSAFQRLSALAHDRDDAGFARTTSTTTRMVVLASCLGAAALAGVAQPVARVFLHGTMGVADPAVLAAAMIAFAPGVVGYGLVAHLGRALYARGSGRASAGATVAGWLGVVVGDIVLVAALPRGQIVAALGWGSSIGMTVAGVALIVATARTAGRDAVAGVARTAAVGVGGGVLAAVVGRFAGDVGGVPGVAGSVGQAFLAGLVVAVVFLGVAWLLDRRDLRGLVGRMRRRGGTPVAEGEQGGERGE